MLVVLGTDYLSTSYTDFDLQVAGLSHPITPSAFDFPNIGIVEFEGKPPAPGRADTIRQRLEPIHLPYPGASPSIAIEWTLVFPPVVIASNCKSFHMLLLHSRLMATQQLYEFLDWQMRLHT